MSFLTACKQSTALLRNTGVLTVARLARSLSTEVPKASTETSAKASDAGDLTVQPTRDVLVADVISGAPSAL